MIGLIAIALVPAFVSSAQAFSPAPTQQPDEFIIKVRHAWDPRMHMVNGRVGRPLTLVSVAGVARRQTRRAVYGIAAVGAAAAAGAYGYYHYPSNGQGFVCQPGTYFHGEDGRRHLCQ